MFYVVKFEMLSSSMTRYFFNKENNSKNTIKELKKICEEDFKDAIKYSEMKYLSKNQKILKILLRFKLYVVIKIAYKLGINKFKKRKK